MCVHNRINISLEKYWQEGKNIDRDKGRSVWKIYIKMLAGLSAYKFSTEPDFSLLEWEFTDKQWEEAMMSHMLSG